MKQRRDRRMRNKQRHPEGDHLTRQMFVITAQGLEPIAVRGSRAASLLGKHAAAVQRFLRTGDSSALDAFRGKRVAGHELITKPRLLTALADAGALRLDDLYVQPTWTA